MSGQLWWGRYRREPRRKEDQKKAKSRELIEEFLRDGGVECGIVICEEWARLRHPLTDWSDRCSDDFDKLQEGSRASRTIQLTGEDFRAGKAFGVMRAM